MRGSAPAPTLGHKARPCPVLLREEVDELLAVLDSDAGDVVTKSKRSRDQRRRRGNEGPGCPYEKRSPPGPGPEYPRKAAHPSRRWRLLAQPTQQQDHEQRDQEALELTACARNAGNSALCLGLLIAFEVSLSGHHWSLAPSRTARSPRVSSFTVEHEAITAVLSVSDSPTCTRAARRPRARRRALKRAAPRGAPGGGRVLSEAGPE